MPCEVDGQILQADKDTEAGNNTAQSVLISVTYLRTHHTRSLRIQVFWLLFHVLFTFRCSFPLVLRVDSLLMQKSVLKIRERRVTLFHPMLPESVVQPPRFTAMLHFTSTKSKLLQLLLVCVSCHNNKDTMPEDSKEVSTSFVHSWVFLEGWAQRWRIYLGKDGRDSIAAWELKWASFWALSKTQTWDHHTKLPQTFSWETRSKRTWGN